MNNYPTYYKDKHINRFIKRISDETGITVQVIGYTNGDFRHLHCKSHFGSKSLMDEHLSPYKECTEEEYVSMIAAFFNKAAEDAKKFRIFRNRKWNDKNEH